MPKVRALVPLTDEEGSIGVGEVVDVSEEQAKEWRADGKVSLVADEEAAAEAAKSGHYSDLTGRTDAPGPAAGTTPSGGPQDEDKPKAKDKK